LAGFLIKRGCWLLFVEVIIIDFLTNVDLFYHVIILQVIWAIGGSYCVLVLDKNGCFYGPGLREELVNSVYRPSCAAASCCESLSLSGWACFFSSNTEGSLSKFLVEEGINKPQTPTE